VRAEGVSRLGDKSSRFVVGLSKWICGSLPIFLPSNGQLFHNRDKVRLADKPGLRAFMSLQELY